MYWFLWTGMLINRVGGFVALFLSLYLTGPRGLSTSLAGLVVGAYGVGGVVGVLLGGVLADRWGRRPTLLLSHFGAAAVMAALGLSRPVLLIAVCAALLGVVASMPGPAFVAAIVDVVPERDRTRAFNLQFWAFNLGLAAASLLAGALARVSFGLLFALDASGTLVTALLLLWKVRETRPTERLPEVAGPASRPPADRLRRHDVPTGRRRGLHTALTDRDYLLFVGLTLLLAILSTQTSTMLPLAMRADHLDPTAYGFLTAYAGVLIVLGQLFVPKLIGAWRKGTVLAAATLLLGLGFASVGLVGTLGGYLVAATVWTAGSMLAAPPNASVIAELSPPELRGRYQSVFYLTFPAAGFIAPAAGGVSLQYLGNWHWAICGLLGVAAAAGHLLISPARERRVRAGHEPQDSKAPLPMPEDFESPVATPSP
jgi:MFS family permease